MPLKRINVGLSPKIHRTASVASGIADETIQDFTDAAVAERAERVINDFKASKPVHSRCDSHSAKK